MISRLLLVLLRIYKLALSPFLGRACRFYPTCSVYAVQAIQLHGAAKGSWLAARRLARCHPFAEGGYDPVPGSDDDQQHRAAVYEQDSATSTDLPRKLESKTVACACGHGRP